MEYSAYDNAPLICAAYRKNWENTEYASKGKKGPLEEKLLQGVIIFS